MIVHVDKHQYQFADQVVAYFCFSGIGIATQEPHAVSSRCQVNAKVYCVSIHLKTAIVGLNDNIIDLTPMQQSLMDNYH